MREWTAYTVFRVKSLHSHVEKSLTCDDVRAASLDHSNMVAMLVEVLGDVVGRVRAAYYHCLLASCVGLWALELRRMYHTGTFEFVETFDVRRKVGFTAGACRQDDVARVKGALGSKSRTRISKYEAYQVVLRRKEMY